MILMWVPLMIVAQKNIDSTVYKTIKVKPGTLDRSVHLADEPHIVYYDPAVKNNKVLLWLTGTGGTTSHVPVDFLTTALESGYKVIAVSFITTPAVSEVCTGDTLNLYPDCASEFRRMRIYGTPRFSLIQDQSQDAIVPRLVKLLQYLSDNDPQGNWSDYLKGKVPDWTKIAIAGQSQGGGMAQFIANSASVYRVISFSGGWDYSDSENRKIAGWYYRKNATPEKNLYAVYHVNELAAQSLKEICTALKIPKDHIFALDKPISFQESELKNKRNPYHGQGIRNVVYKPIWKTMLGSGK